MVYLYKLYLGISKEHPAFRVGVADFSLQYSQNQNPPERKETLLFSIATKKKGAIRNRVVCLTAASLTVVTGTGWRVVSTVHWHATAAVLHSGGGSTRSLMQRR